MDWLTGAVSLPFLGALLHPLLGLSIQKANGLGVGMTVMVAVANVITTLIFLGYLAPEGGWILSGRDFWAIGNGVLFFWGQWFSIQSVKAGDLAVHSSALGIKVLVVASFSLMVGLEPASWSLLGGVVLAVLAVFLVAGGSLEGWREHRKTVGLTLVACGFFGMNDFLTGWAAKEVGPARWLLLMMGTSGGISILLLWRRRKQLPDLWRVKRSGALVLSGGLCLGVQALLVNLAFSEWQQPTLSNVVYSSRGVVAVIFLWLLGRKLDPRFRRKQMAGALLMTGALAIVLSS